MINVPVVVLVLLFILLVALIYKYSSTKSRCVATYVTGIVSKIEHLPRQERIEAVPYTARPSTINEISPLSPPPPPPPSSVREIPIKFEGEDEGRLPEPSAPIEGGNKDKEPETLQIGDEDIF